MRITAEAKQDTRDRILSRARDLFASRGFAETTTRDVAAVAGVAAGTLFNYFPNKEALGMTLLAEALEQGTVDWQRQRREGVSLDEALFALIAALLRALAPHRLYVGEVMATAMSPFTRSNVSTEGDAFRAEHLETVRGLLLGPGRETAEDAGPTFVSMHLYWTLFLGVLAFWSTDESPHQEDTLAVLDQSLQLFVASLLGDATTRDLSS